MERYFKKKQKSLDSSCFDNSNQESVPSPCIDISEERPCIHDKIGESSKVNNSKRLREEFNLDEIISDPGLRPLIFDYHVNIRDQVRRAYWLKGPCQHRNHQFKWTYFGKDPRRFIGDWFNLYGDWLEYSISKDAAFCLCCYLFRVDHGDQSGGNIFATTGWSYWKKSTKLQKHVGAYDSAHNVALRKCQLLIDQKSHITVALSKQSDISKADYRARLIASIDVVRFLLRQGLPFRGHDESETSNNQGNFIELLEWLADHNDNVARVSLKNAPENLKLTSPQIQKDIVSVIACEIRKILIFEIGDEPFSILVDESRDISVKEQMAVIFRYVDKKGCVIECFFAIIHISDTTALSLKAAIDMLFSTHGLSISRLRGQGYDGASNMQGVYKGLKSLIMRENESAHYVHCFAHQLQLALIGVANNDCQIAMLFSLITSISNIVGASCQRRDSLREKEVARIAAGLDNGEISSGHGLNQETNIKRAGDTRWGSHFNSILSLILMFSSVIDVLDDIRLSGTDFKKRSEASDILTFVQTYEFAFNLYLMKTILGMTNDLSQALQKKDQNIINAMHLVKITKIQLQKLRDSGWESLITEVKLFCDKHQIESLDMNDSFRALGRSRRKVEERTNLHHYRVDVFYSVIDLQLNELNHRFNEVNTELLICMSCFDPSDNFSAFDIQKLLCLAKFYPSDFSQIQLMTLQSQLETYVLDVRSRVEFSDLNGISGLAKQFVRIKLDITYSLVYLLIKLILLLPVATATVERAFSAMKIIKTRLRNRMSDE